MDTERIFKRKIYDRLLKWKVSCMVRPYQETNCCLIMVSIFFPIPVLVAVSQER